MKIAIDCVHYPISPKQSSHRSSWARYWKWYLSKLYENENPQIDILPRGKEDTWKDYDAVYFYHGMEYQEGVMNLAGGFADWMKPRFLAYADLINSIPKGEDPKTWVYSIENPMPDYYELLKKRGVEMEELKNVQNHVHKVDIPQTERIVLGDSHSLSIMDSPTGEFVKVYRTDFKTLNGALNLGLENVRDIDWSKVAHCTFFFGMIDLRHHVFRYGGLEAVTNLISRLQIQLQELEKKYGIKIELCEFYPMTKDSRKLPKSGFYEGTPFYGELKDRVEAVKLFNSELKKMCQRHGWDFYKHPEIFSDPTDDTMDEFFMEKPRSVHMSSEFYRFDLEEGHTREW